MDRTLILTCLAALALTALPTAAADHPSVGTMFLDCEDPQQYDTDGDGSEETWTRCHGPPCLAVETYSVHATASVTYGGEQTFVAAGANGGCYGAGVGSEDEEPSETDAEADADASLPPVLGPDLQICEAFSEPVCP